MAISTADFKNGLTIEFEGKVFQIMDFQHVKPGKGGAFVRSRLKNLQNGATFDKTWRAGESMEAALVERRNVEFLYRDGDDFIFMDMEDFEQMQLSAAQVGDAAKFLKDNTPVQVTTWKANILGVETPQTMEFVVAETDPGLRGDTAQGGTKPRDAGNRRRRDRAAFRQSGRIHSRGHPQRQLHRTRQVAKAGSGRAKRRAFFTFGAPSPSR